MILADVAQPLINENTLPWVIASVVFFIALFVAILIFWFVIPNIE